MKTKSIKSGLIRGVLFFIFILFSSGLKSQDYLIDFVGAGASPDVDSVFIENLMQGTTLKMKGSEILHLNVVTDVENVSDNGESDILLYPNPASDNAKMQFFLPFTGETLLSLYDITGRKIAERKDFLSAGKQTYGIYGTGKGIYFIRISSGTYVISNKLIGNGSGDTNVRLEYEDTFTINKKEVGEKGIYVEKEMEYISGDRLKIKGVSGIYSTVLTLVPTEDRTVTFNFYACTDGSGNNYPIVIIGGGKGEYGEPDPENKAGAQIWMGENLKTTKLNTGVDLSYGDNEKWMEKPACCSYNDEERNVKSYGLLYNIYTIQSTKLCPVGWIIPPEEAYDALTDFLDGKDRAGGPLKETGSLYWSSTSGGTSNSTGFSGRPGGERTYNTYSAMGTTAQFWTANFYNGRAQYFVLYSFTDETQILSPYQWYQGYSVRCIMK